MHYVLHLQLHAFITVYFLDCNMCTAEFLDSLHTSGLYNLYHYVPYYSWISRSIVVSIEINLYKNCKEYSVAIFFTCG